ncbi:hypothetical protein [Streptomyces sp. NPDC059134]|uniref:hypothetical protein n=1 Tax=Streptomyces sp. NPDC059134 TaxID=3346738 RepID=UPI0036B7AFA4
MASLLVAALIAVVVVIVTPLLGGSSDPSSPPAGPDDGAIEVDLERRIADFATVKVADARYLPPKRVERDILAEGVSLYVDGKHEEAERRLAEVDFGVRILRDSVRAPAPAGSADSAGSAKSDASDADDVAYAGAGSSTGAGSAAYTASAASSMDAASDAPGRRYAEIADRAGENMRGWGRVYVALDDPVHYSVQVPHPVADAYSDLLGVGILRSAPGGVLVMAGTHRTAGEGKAADVAHRRDTVFHAVCAELVARRLPGIQVHGFADSSAPDHDLVVSTGAGETARPQAVDLARALTDDGFRVCRAWSAKCPLAGRKNKQGVLAADQDVPFLHVETSRAVRTDPARMGDAIAAMAETARRWA